GAGYDNQRLGNVVGARETVGTTMVQKSGIQCYNCKEFGHVKRECQKPKKAKDTAYHREKILLYQELEAHYMYMAQIQDVSPDAADDSGPIFDTEPLQKHQNEVNELRVERIARTTNPLALVAQQQPVYHPQNHPTHYTQNSSTKSQQTATRNRGKAIVNSPSLIYDQEPSMVAEDDEMSKDKEIDKLMAIIYLSFKKIYKPTNNNLRTSSNTSRANQDNSPRINRGVGYDNQRLGNVAGARETVDAADDSGPIFDTEPLQKVQNDDHYNVFTIKSEHPEQSKSVNDTYLIKQDEDNAIIDSLDMSYDREQID
nr:hypothetical protein [Tanacetum cinerariifolium]